MKAHSAQSSKQPDMARLLDPSQDALQRFLATPPPNTPTAVLDAVADALTTRYKALPPRIYAEAVEQSSVAISITNHRGYILYANQAFEHVTGYTSDEVTGQNESMLSSKRTPSIVYKTLWGRLKQGEPWSGLLLNARKSGQLYLAEVTIAPVVFGDELYYLGMHRDVTEVTQLQKRVKNQKALIESVVDASPVVTALLDENGKVVLDNHAYKKLFGDMGGKEPAIALLDVLKETQAWDFDTAREQRRDIEHCEVAITTGHQTRWFAFTGTWFQEGDTEIDNYFARYQQQRIYLLLVASEITALKHQQEAVSRNAMRALLAEQAQVEEVRETLAAAIYQIQGPINLITAAANIYGRRLNDKRPPSGLLGEDALAKALKEAIAAGEKALETLSAAMPHLPDESPMPLNVNELLREVLALLTQRLLAEGVTVEWQPAAVLPTFVGRGQRLRGLFKQLIENGIDAMVGGERRELRLATGTDEGAIWITIADTGPGIPSALRLKVFEPFFTTKPSASHSGMGLALAQEAVIAHGGTLFVEPSHRHGCCMCVRLPLNYDGS